MRRGILFLLRRVNDVKLERRAQWNLTICFLEGENEIIYFRKNVNYIKPKNDIIINEAYPARK